jgi:hypothetical protein
MALNIEYEWDVANLQATAQAFLALNDSEDSDDPIKTEADAVEILLSRLRIDMVQMYSNLSESLPEHDHFWIYKSIWVAIKISCNTAIDGGDRLIFGPQGTVLRDFGAVDRRESGVVKVATLKIDHPKSINALMEVNFLTLLRNR